MQENCCVADLTLDPVMIDSIINKSCLHVAFAKMIYPEIKDLSDDEVKKNHSEKRTAAKAPRFAINFGGTGYTIHINEGIPLDEANRIEQAYKELHPGIIKYGQEKLKEAIELGYIKYALGFRLHLPFYDEFKKKHEWINSLTRNWWDQYKIGKQEYKKKKENDEYTVKKQFAYDLYRKYASEISKYYSKKGEYLRLCLNAPSQGTAAHQTKAATNKVYEYIWKKKHFWKARIALVVHDEIDMEVIQELSKEYQKVIEYNMINEGNKLLLNNVITMETECKINTNWYNAK